MLCHMYGLRVTLFQADSASKSNEDDDWTVRDHTCALFNISMHNCMQFTSVYVYSNVTL